MFRKGIVTFFDESSGKGHIALSTDHQQVVFKLEDFSNQSVLPQIGERFKCVILQQHGEHLAKFIVRLDHKNYVASQKNALSRAHFYEDGTDDSVRNIRKILKKRRASSDIAVLEDGQANVIDHLEQDSQTDSQEDKQAIAEDVTVSEHLPISTALAIIPIETDTDTDDSVVQDISIEEAVIQGLVIEGIVIQEAATQQEPIRKASTLDESLQDTHPINNEKRFDQTSQENSIESIIDYEDVIQDIIVDHKEIAIPHINEVNSTEAINDAIPDVDVVQHIASINVNDETLASIQANEEDVGQQATSTNETNILNSIAETESIIVEEMTQPVESPHHIVAVDITTIEDYALVVEPSAINLTESKEITSQQIVAEAVEAVELIPETNLIQQENEVHKVELIKNIATVNIHKDDTQIQSNLELEHSQRIDVSMLFEKNKSESGLVESSEDQKKNKSLLDDVAEERDVDEVESIDSSINHRNQQILEKNMNLNILQRCMQSIRVKFLYSKRKQPKIKKETDKKFSFNPWIIVTIGILLFGVNFIFYAIDRYQQYQSNNLIKLQQYKKAQHDEIKRQKKEAQSK